ncbi:MAG: chemotaxis protein CheA [Oscillospiraceae bacterium]|nr:chemotaxis protein CheA [Oscillospiraceae bacterium]
MAKVEAGMEGMVDMYLFETTTLIDQLDEVLLRTEQANEFTEDDINEVFRIMHTVKGSSAMMGFENLQKLAHKGEDMFFIIREDPSKMKDIGFVYDLVFQMSDLFKAEIEEIRDNPDGDPTDFSEMIAKLENGAKILKGELEADQLDAAPAEAPAPAESKEESAPAPAPAAAAAGGAGNSVIRVFFEQESKMENLRAFLLLGKIKEVCDVIDWSPRDVETNPDTCTKIQEEGFLVTVHKDDEAVAIKAVEESVNVDTYEIVKPDGAEEKPAAAAPAEEKPAASAAAPAAAKPAASAAAPAKKTEKPAANAGNAGGGGGGKQSLISVNLIKLDQLHDIVGEIITTESMVVSNPELDGLKLESFQKAARDLRKLTDELQDTVMSIRMVPLVGPFQKMHRIVRDMKQKLGKDVELILEGEDTEVDKSIVDNLNDPLMHLVRNCMDHGIEDDVNERLEHGKPAKGTIKLSAMSSSGEVIITISDDGGGIDTDKVLRKAEEQGLLTRPMNEYSEREINNMIMLPGFSTNTEVTEYSGRGVGMDVVKKNIEKSGGSVFVESKRHEGSSFIIKIPLTLAIIAGMEVRVGDIIFTVPISAIKQSFKIKNDQIIYDTQGNEMIMIRGECYPILKLYDKYALKTEITDFEQGILILVEADGKSVCLFADRLVGEQQVVVKPFPSYLSRYNLKGEGLSGCSIMGDGSISLIIDVNSIIDKQ